MRTKKVGNFQETGTGIQSSVFVGKCCDEMCKCLAEGVVRERVSFCEEEKMITSQQKRARLTLGRPSQYPLPQGLLIGIHEK